MSKIIITSTTNVKEAAALSDLADESTPVEPAVEAKAETETPEESEAQELNAKTGSEDEEGDEQVEEKPKKQGGFKRRIDKLTKQKAAAEQERDIWRQEALKNQKAPAEKQSTAPEKTEPKGKPKADDFESHEEYVEAVTDWKVEQKLSARDAKQKETETLSEHQKQVNAHFERVGTFKETHDDFDDVIESIDDITMSPTVQQMILDSEHGAELMYLCGQNREEYARICKLPALAAAREFGKFEAKFLKTSESTEVKEAKTTKAPPPVKPIGAKGNTGKKSLGDPNTSQKEYEELRREQIKRHRAAW